MDETDLKNNYPPILVDYFYIVTDFIGNYGWILILIIFILYVIVQKIYNLMRDSYLEKQADKLEATYRNDASKLQERALGLERARQKMQEKLDRDAEVFAMKQKMKEEKKRNEWLQRHGENVTQSGTKLGYGNDSSQECNKKFKKEYNPLTGDSSGPSYRAPKKSGCGNGGCG